MDQFKVSSIWFVSKRINDIDNGALSTFDVLSMCRLRLLFTHVTGSKWRHYYSQMLWVWKILSCYCCLKPAPQCLILAFTQHNYLNSAPRLFQKTLKKHCWHLLWSIGAKANKYKQCSAHPTQYLSLLYWNYRQEFNSNSLWNLIFFSWSLPDELLFSLFFSLNPPSQPHKSELFICVCIVSVLVGFDATVTL